MPFRTPLLSLLRAYAAEGDIDAAELEMVGRTITFVAATPTCFERSHLPGHVTGSAWVVDDDFQAALLLHHGKLNRWLQPGGHADGDPDVAAVALREAREETGLDDLRIVRDRIFDVDVHEIPEHKGVPAHWHYDIRFLIHANRQQQPTLSAESKAIRWVGLAVIGEYTTHPAVHRMTNKAIAAGARVRASAR